MHPLRRVKSRREDSFVGAPAPLTTFSPTSASTAAPAGGQVPPIAATGSSPRTEEGEEAPPKDLYGDDLFQVCERFGVGVRLLRDYARWKVQHGPLSRDEEDYDYEDSMMMYRDEEDRLAAAEASVTATEFVTWLTEREHITVNSPRTSERARRRWRTAIDHVLESNRALMVASQSWHNITGSLKELRSARSSMADFSEATSLQRRLLHLGRRTEQTLRGKRRLVPLLSHGDAAEATHSEAIRRIRLEQSREEILAAARLFRENKGKGNDVDGLISEMCRGSSPTAVASRQLRHMRDQRLDRHVAPLPQREESFFELEPPPLLDESSEGSPVLMATSASFGHIDLGFGDSFPSGSPGDPQQQELHRQGSLSPSPVAPSPTHSCAGEPTTESTAQFAEILKPRKTSPPPSSLLPPPPPPPPPPAADDQGEGKEARSDDEQPGHQDSRCTEEGAGKKTSVSPEKEGDEEKAVEVETDESKMMSRWTQCQSSSLWSEARHIVFSPVRPRWKPFLDGARKKSPSPEEDVSCPRMAQPCRAPLLRRSGYNGRVPLSRQGMRSRKRI